MTEPRVVVAGEAVVTVPPDAASFTVTVQARDRRRERALDLLAQRQTDLVALLDRHAGTLGERVTESVWVHPEHDDRGRAVGYVASVSTRVRLDDVTAAGSFSSEVGTLDGTEVHGPHWQLKPGSPAHAEARLLAVTDALDRARGYAAALGATITGLVELRDHGTSSAHGIVMAATFAGRPTLDLEPAPQEVPGRVELTVTISAPDATVLSG